MIAPRGMGCERRGSLSLCSRRTRRRRDEVTALLLLYKPFLITASVTCSLLVVLVGTLRLAPIAFVVVLLLPLLLLSLWRLLLLPLMMRVQRHIRDLSVGRL